VISNTVIRRRPTSDFRGQRASDIALQAGFDTAARPDIVHGIMGIPRFLRGMNLLLRQGLLKP
jgi:hypothetical protein